MRLHLLLITCIPTSAIVGRFFRRKNSDILRRDIWYINGTIPTKGGTASVHNNNGTFEDTTITFGPGQSYRTSPGIDHDITLTIGTTTHHGRAICQKGRDCIQLLWYAPPSPPKPPHMVALLEKGPNPPPPPPVGTCSIYSAVRATGPATQDGKSVEVAVDFKGNVVPQATR